MPSQLHTPAPTPLPAKSEKNPFSPASVARNPAGVVPTMQNPPVSTSPVSTPRSAIDTSSGASALDRVVRLGQEKLAETRNALPLSSEAAPMRMGRRLKTRVVAPAAPIPTGTPDPTSQNTTKAVATARGHYYQAGAPQFSGFVRAEKSEAGDQNNLDQNNSNGPSDPNARLYPPCGTAIVALATFYLDLPDGRTGLVEKDDVIDSPAVIYLVTTQGKPYRIATDVER